MPDHFLLNADKMTMAAPVELRVPFLDHRLVEFASSLPDHLRLHQGQSKRIFRDSVAALLPEPVVARRKIGLPVPARRWFSGELSPMIGNGIENFLRLPWIDSDCLRKLFRGPRQLTGEPSRLVMNLLVLDCRRQRHGIQPTKFLDSGRIAAEKFGLPTIA